MDAPPLITTLAAGLTCAWLLGLITQKIGLSPIVGYLLAGVLIGPHTPGFVGDSHLAHQLAEVGVILLMFGVGLHFHWKDLLAVRGIAIPGAIGQSAIATLVAMAVFTPLGIPLGAGAVLGMAMAVASTVVLMRVLMDANVLDSPQGHIAVGWLLVEDVFTVIVLVLIPVLSAGSSGEAASGVWTTVAVAMLKLALLVAIVMLVGLRAIPWILVQVARLRSRELFTLTVLVISIAIATASYVFFGASMALGAFLAGMVVAQSPVSHQAAADALPLRDAFAVLFFVSVGMIFDPAFVLKEPLMILAALGVVLVAKPLAALFIVVLLGHSARAALTVALGLAQIGEFSFILSDLARKHGLMPEDGQNVLVAAAIVSITLNPMLFRALPRIEAALRRRPRLWRLLNRRAKSRLRGTALMEHGATLAPENASLRALVIGYGPVGRSVDRLLRDAGLETTVVDLNMDTVSELNAQGRSAVFGDASREGVLERAGVHGASFMVVALPYSAPRAAVVSAARGMNGALRVFVRAHYLREHDELALAGATAAVFEEEAAAVALARLVLAQTGASRGALEDAVRDLRLRMILETAPRLGSRSVRSVMVPWIRVERAIVDEPIESVLRKVAHDPHASCLVLDRAGGRPIGYVRARDLAGQAPSSAEWTALARPLATVGPDDTLERALIQLQESGTSLAVVLQGEQPVGSISVEEILERAEGQIAESETPERALPSLWEAIVNGAMLLEVEHRSAHAAIAELAGTIPRGKLPPGVDIAELAIARERVVSTDVGCGVAVPHARCPGLRSAFVVFGRSLDGIPFTATSRAPVHLLFLIVTPMDRPETQVHLLGRIARLVSDAAVRERLSTASSAADVLEVISTAERREESAAAAEPGNA